MERRKKNRKQGRGEMSPERKSWGKRNTEEEARLGEEEETRSKAGERGAKKQIGGEEKEGRKERSRERREKKKRENRARERGVKRKQRVWGRRVMKRRKSN